MAEVAESRGHLPNLFIIGAAKSGTTSLHRYLASHPSIFMSRVKELHLFTRGDWRERLDWYRAQFRSSLPVRGESSPSYSMDPWFSSVPERMHELTPEARLIYLVRDPIERIVAQYVEFFALRFEERPFEEALADFDSPTNRYVMPSRYAHQLDRYREWFSDERILVLDQQELLEARRRTLQEAFSFLGVEPNFVGREFAHAYNTRPQKVRGKGSAVWLNNRGLLQPARRASRALPGAMRERLKMLVADPVATPTVAPRLRSELAQHLGEDVQRLRTYTGRRFASWSV